MFCTDKLGGILAALMLIGNASGAAPTETGPPWSPAFVQQAVAEARVAGDPRRGAGVFHTATTGCASCHRVGGDGGAVGPELTRVANCLTPEEIVESLYWPARSVKPEYRAAFARGE